MFKILNHIFDQGYSITINGSGKAGNSLILELKDEKFHIKIYDQIPPGYVVNLLASELGVFDPEFALESVTTIVNVENLEEFLHNAQKCWQKYGIFNVEYEEKEDNFEIKDNCMNFPIKSSSSGVLGKLKIYGNLNTKFVLNFLTISDTIVSILEGLIIRHRISELLKSTMSALAEALGRRVEIENEKRKFIENNIIKLGEKFGFDKELMRLCAQVYDIGKIGVPDKVFKKQTLTEEEQKLVEKHVDFGYEILNKIEGIPGEILDAVLFHHERIDGSGPKKVKKVPLIAQIVGLVDELANYPEKDLKKEIEKLKGKFSDTILEEMKKSL
ncbi:HD domain-containing protein [Thermosipho ferrireducens]|uniref:HD domain-containing protein n=1 Tax=Thermosipho ferrireducens TaxID=2571116 RepID=A0ABX7S937_9BACT|nr:HD domain-containing phosphohydrolase [Thermosipho ferrireducens]QTA38192.1 HD domain-containing protein [Thermosipho ferrireducens]